MLVFTVSLTPAAMGAPDYPPKPSDSEDTNPGKNPVDEIKKATKDSSYYGTAKNVNAKTPYDNFSIFFWNIFQKVFSAFYALLFNFSTFH